MIFDSLDVVVPFPFTDGRAIKRRPALIVSSAIFNRAHEQSDPGDDHLTGSDWPSDVSILGWRQAGLNVPCKVRFKLFTLDDALIVRKLVSLSKQDGGAVKIALGRVLASNGQIATG